MTNYFQFWARVGAPPFESSQVKGRDLRVPPDRASQWRPGTGIGPALVAWQLKGDEIPAGDSPGRLPSLCPLLIHWQLPHAYGSPLPCGI